MNLVSINIEKDCNIIDHREVHHYRDYEEFECFEPIWTRAGFEAVEKKIDRDNTVQVAYLRVTKLEHYYFEENRNAYTVEMLDKELEPGSDTLRTFLDYGSESGYFTVNKPYEEMTTSELSHLLDWIDYLETK